MLIINSFLTAWLVPCLLANGPSFAAGAEAKVARRPDLTGSVSAPDGSPLPGASVFVYSAGPKVGRGML